MEEKKDGLEVADQNAAIASRQTPFSNIRFLHNSNFTNNFVLEI